MDGLGLAITAFLLWIVLVAGLLMVFNATDGENINRYDAIIGDQAYRCTEYVDRDHRVVCVGVDRNIPLPEAG